MEKRLKVLICGDTLVLGCLRASLAAYEGLELANIEAQAASEHDLRGLNPDVIIFDLEAGWPAFPYSLVVRSPDLLLVGVDSATNRVLTWSGRQLCQLSTEELVEVIAGARPGPVPPEDRKPGNDDEDLQRMSELLGLALADETFRAQLSADPQAAGRRLGLTLSEEEVAALRASDLSKMAEGLDERLSKALFRFRPG